MLMLIGFGVVSILFYIAKEHLPKKPEQIIPHLKKGKLIYKDSTAKFYFSSLNYKIRAKPDFIYKVDEEYILVEYKSRKGNVNASDIAQVVASALAVKETYPRLVTAYIYTLGGDIKTINLNKPNHHLASQIKNELDFVRAIETNNPLFFNPQSHKCKACSFKLSCKLMVA